VPPRNDMGRAFRPPMRLAELMEPVCQTTCPTAALILAKFHRSVLGLASPAVTRHRHPGQPDDLRQFLLVLGAVTRFAGQQDLAQHMKISGQHSQTDMAFVAGFRAVPAAIQAVARLQGGR